MILLLLQFASSQNYCVCQVTTCNQNDFCSGMIPISINETYRIQLPLESSSNEMNYVYIDRISDTEHIREIYVSDFHGQNVTFVPNEKKTIDPKQKYQKLSIIIDTTYSTANIFCQDLYLLQISSTVTNPYIQTFGISNCKNLISQSISKFSSEFLFLDFASSIILQPVFNREESKIKTYILNGSKEVTKIEFSSNKYVYYHNDQSSSLTINANLGSPSKLIFQSKLIREWSETLISLTLASKDGFVLPLTIDSFSATIIFQDSIQDARNLTINYGINSLCLHVPSNIPGTISSMNSTTLESYVKLKGSGHLVVLKDPYRLCLQSGIVTCPSGWVQQDFSSTFEMPSSYLYFDLVIASTQTQITISNVNNKTVKVSKRHSDPFLLIIGNDCDSTTSIVVTDITLSYKGTTKVEINSLMLLGSSEFKDSPQYVSPKFLTIVLPTNKNNDIISAISQYDQLKQLVIIDPESNSRNITYKSQREVNFALSSSTTIPISLFSSSTLIYYLTLSNTLTFYLNTRCDIYASMCIVVMSSNASITMDGSWSTYGIFDKIFSLKFYNEKHQIYYQGMIMYPFVDFSDYNYMEPNVVNNITLCLGKTADCSSIDSYAYSWPSSDEITSFISKQINFFYLNIIVFQGQTRTLALSNFAVFNFYCLVIKSGVEGTVYPISIQLGKGLSFSIALDGVCAQTKFSEETSLFLLDLYNNAYIQYVSGRQLFNIEIALFEFDSLKQTLSNNFISSFLSINHLIVNCSDKVNTISLDSEKWVLYETDNSFCEISSSIIHSDENLHPYPYIISTLNRIPNFQTLKLAIPKNVYQALGIELELQSPEIIFSKDWQNGDASLANNSKIIIHYGDDPLFIISLPTSFKDNQLEYYGYGVCLFLDNCIRYCIADSNELCPPGWADIIQPSFSADFHSDSVEILFTSQDDCTITNPSFLENRISVFSGYNFVPQITITFYPTSDDQDLKLENSYLVISNSSIIFKSNNTENPPTISLFIMHIIEATGSFNQIYGSFSIDHISIKNVIIDSFFSPLSAISNETISAITSEFYIYALYETITNIAFSESSLTLSYLSFLDDEIKNVRFPAANCLDNRPATLFIFQPQDFINVTLIEPTPGMTVQGIMLFFNSDNSSNTLMFTEDWYNNQVTFAPSHYFIISNELNFAEVTLITPSSSLPSKIFVQDEKLLTTINNFGRDNICIVSSQIASLQCPKGSSTLFYNSSTHHLSEISLNYLKSLQNPIVYFVTQSSNEYPILNLSDLPINNDFIGIKYESVIPSVKFIYSSNFTSKSSFCSTIKSLSIEFISNEDSTLTFDLLKLEDVVISTNSNSSTSLVVHSLISSLCSYSSLINTFSKVEIKSKFNLLLFDMNTLNFRNSQWVIKDQTGSITLERTSNFIPTLEVFQTSSTDSINISSEDTTLFSPINIELKSDARFYFYNSWFNHSFSSGDLVVDLFSYTLYLLSENDEYPTFTIHSVGLADNIIQIKTISQTTTTIKGKSTGKIIGIVIAAIILVVIIVIIVIIIKKHNKIIDDSSDGGDTRVVII